MVRKTHITCDRCGKLELNAPMANCVVCNHDLCSECSTEVGKVWICKDHLLKTVIPLRVLNKIFNTHYGISYLEQGQWDMFERYKHSDWLILNISDDGECTFNLATSIKDANIVAADHAYHGEEAYVTIAYHNGNFYEPETTTTLVKK